MGRLVQYINDTCDIREVYRECLGHYPSNGKFLCPNPLHVHNSNTPSAKIYGNVIKCFGQCGRCFGAYDLYKWYLPKRIEEIKTSEVIPLESSNNSKVVITKVVVDRSRPIKDILQQITGICV